MIIFIRREKNRGFMQELYFKLNTIYAILNGYTTFESGVVRNVRMLIPHIKKRGFDKIIIYGAGRAGEQVAKILQKDKELEILCLAVTDKKENEKSSGNTSQTD